MQRGVDFCNLSGSPKFRIWFVRVFTYVRFVNINWNMEFSFEGYHDDIWIGGYFENDKWLWADRSPLVYSNWRDSDSSKCIDKEKCCMLKQREYGKRFYIILVYSLKFILWNNFQTSFLLRLRNFLSKHFIWKPLQEIGNPKTAPRREPIFALWTKK